MDIKWRKAILSLACAASVLFGAVGAKAEAIHEKDLEDYILSQMTLAHVTGMSISIVSSEKELYCAAYGAAEKTTKDYILGDLSKSFTAAAIMRLAEDSELRLEDPVGDYLPEYQKISDVTIKDLLQHTSGITKYEVMSDIQAKGTKGSFSYANANYNLLGKIIEAVTGTSYIEYVSDNILDPLDMDSTYSLENISGHEGEMVKGFRNYFGFPFAYKNAYDEKEDWKQVSSGYLVSDVKDMGNYLRMYLQGGGKVLSKKSVKTMLSQGISVGDNQDIREEIVDAEAKYAMGWIEKEVGGERMLYHTGSVENYTSAMILLPGKDLGISLMFNGADALAGQNLIEQLEAGILAIELEQKPSGVDSRAFYLKHISVDVAMIVLLLGVWVPIFLMGFWRKRRRNNLWSPVGIGIDALVHLVLPTLLLIIMWQAMPIMWMRRFYPAIYYVSMAAIASLYFGAVVKAIAMVIYALRGSIEDEQTEEIEPSEEKGKEASQEMSAEPEKETEEQQSDKKEEEPAEPEPEKEAEEQQSDEKEEEPAEPEKETKEQQSDEKEEEPAEPEMEAEEQQSDKEEEETAKPEKEAKEQSDEKEEKAVEPEKETKE